MPTGQSESPGQLVGAFSTYTLMSEIERIIHLVLPANTQSNVFPHSIYEKFIFYIIILLSEN
jgi:hypothetical protein